MDKYLTDLVDLTYKRKYKIIDYKKASKNNLDVFNIMETKSKAEAEMTESKCNDCYLKDQHIELFAEKKVYLDEYQKLTNDIKEENFQFYNEFMIRLKVLTKYQYIDSDNQILLKSKAAREISTSDCVLITELLFSNILDILSSNELVAFLSGMTFSKNEINFDDPKISDEFSAVNIIEINNSGNHRV